MIFNSIQYLLFLAVTVILYYVFPHKIRWILLLAASYCFYACWNVRMLFWLLLVTLISYGTGIGIARKETAARKKIILSSGVIVLLLLLFAFKYVNFFLEQIEGIAGLFRAGTLLPRTDWVMPVGISFFTFQAIGYMVDVFRGKCEVCRHAGKYALYIGFFPHLAEGPIDRTDNLLPQINERHSFDERLFRRGFLLICFGLFKKMVVADRLGVLVDSAYQSVSAFNGGTFWITSVFYTFQIYCDFSGYTDIAIGSASLMGFRLAENFRTPYLATSIADFWRRWHMSLTRWFRDYIYIPLGGNRVSEAKWVRNVLIVFLVSGLWHGAAWTFILWGLAHGMFQIIGKYKSKITRSLTQKKRFWIYIGQVLTTFFLVNLLWVVFRINSMGDLFTVFQKMVTDPFTINLTGLGIANEELIASCILIGVIVLTDILEEKTRLSQRIENAILPVRWIIYLLLLLSVIMFGKYGALTTDSFIYFQF